ncbi:MAG TPA: disulfide bond formation protein B [Mesorhizobium sp.]|jgi:disulfide bond formation protein DsbB|nr:disulfide bond formation protein B [Mesorhizobium sp.]
MASASPSRFHATAALVLLLGMAATVGGALLFQHWGGYIPCALCLEQRVPYYLGMPAAAAALLGAVLHAPAALTRTLLAVAGLLMLWGAYQGAFHAGVEWGWWVGPTDCGAVAAPADTGGQGVLDALDQVIPPSCDQAALRILGLSLAGWNFLAALGLGLIALWAAFRRPRAA